MANDPHNPHDPSRKAASFGPTVLPPLVVFVVAGLLGPLYSDERFELGRTAWSAVVLWPIGLCLLGVPALVLLDARTARALRCGQVAIGLLGVASTVAVARSDDAQAGLWFAYPPVVGTVLAVLIVAVGGQRRGR